MSTRPGGQMALAVRAALEAEPCCGECDEAPLERMDCPGCTAAVLRAGISVLLGRKLTRDEEYTLRLEVVS